MDRSALLGKQVCHRRQELGSHRRQTVEKQASHRRQTVEKLGRHCRQTVDANVGVIHRLAGVAT